LLPIVLFVKAVVAGFVVALPVGAIGAMCMRRALSGRWIDSIVTGTGAAIADSIMAAAALVGLSLVSAWLVEHTTIVRIAGGFVLLVIGVRMIVKRRSARVARPFGSPVRAAEWRAWIIDFATGLGLTLINPATLLAFAGVFAGLGLLEQFAEGDITARSTVGIIVIGAFAGSMLWWTTLTVAASAMRQWVPMHIVPWVNVFFGFVVVACGLLAVFVGAGVAPSYWLRLHE
jgi:threonine/homoserine/homoserine lactone efflux protein